MSETSRLKWPRPFAGLQGITWASLPREVSAGITLAALIIPLNIGYAQVAGLPPAVGLYAGIIPLALFALFTSSRQVVGSPDAPSASRSAAMDDAGAGGQFPSLVAAGTIALVMIFFTEELAYLPNAALAGIVANVVLKLIEVGELRELWHMRRSEFWIASVCLLSVLVLGPLRAVIIAFLLATIDVLRRASRPGTWVLQEAADGSHFIPVEVDRGPDTSGLVVYRFGAPLYFANTTLFEEEVEKLVTQAATPVKWFVLDAEAMVDIDSSGAETLHQVLTSLTHRGVTVALSRANQTTTNLLVHYHLLELIGEKRLYPTNRHAVAAFRQETG